MAFTLAVRFSATLFDGLNVEALSQAYVLVDPTQTFTAVLTTFETWLAYLDACTDGVIIAAAMHAYPALPGGLKTQATNPTAFAASRAEQTGILNFSATGTTHRWGFAVPALSNGATVIAGGKPVLTAGAPLDVLRALLAGGGTASLEWTNSNQQPLVTLLDALISFRQRADQLARRTYER